MSSLKKQADDIIKIAKTEGTWNFDVTYIMPLIKRIEELEAQVEWQPIETATPLDKDDESLHPYSTIDVIVFDGKSVRVAEYEVGSYETNDGKVTWGEFRGWRLEPTHWMPLPEPPKESK